MNKIKKIIISVCAAVLAAAIGAGVFYAVRLDGYKSSPLKLPDGFTYTAHTGCIGTKDNSLESIDAAVEYGANIVEFDLNFNENGEPVLAHDAPKGGEVTLDEAFERVSRYEGLMVNVDAKSVAALEKVAPAAEKYGILDRIFYTGIEEKDVETVKKDSPEVPYYLNIDVEPERKHTEEYLMSLVQKVKECGALGINCSKKNVTKELVEVFHENGLLVSIWTVNGDMEIYKILSFSPDNITTRRPDKLQKAVYGLLARFT